VTKKRRYLEKELKATLAQGGHAKLRDLLLFAYDALPPS
jgi:hypothetical protein